MSARARAARRRSGAHRVETSVFVFSAHGRINVMTRVSHHRAEGRRAHASRALYARHGKSQRGPQRPTPLQKLRRRQSPRAREPHARH